LFGLSDDDTLYADFVFYDRCGHCKKLAPEYEKLGASFKKAKSVLIGKVTSKTLEHLPHPHLNYQFL